MNSLSNFVFQGHKFLWVDKERTRGERRLERQGGREEREKEERLQAAAAVAATESGGGETVGRTGTGNGCEVAAVAAGAPRRPRRGSS